MSERISVPRIWPNSTIACLATGPSLTQADVDYVRGKVDVVIAVNDAYTLAPWADVFYAADGKWWGWHYKAVKQLSGLKYSIDARSGQYPGVQVLRNLGEDGLSDDPTGVRTGKNSGYQAVNLAVLFGANRIILLGYDMQGGHFFGKHPDKSGPPFLLLHRKWPTIVEPLKQAGVTVVNCTRTTAVRVFPRLPLEAALG
jgi:hypothetical protein